ncbi:hypothetical protein AKJ12_16900 [Xanthomonas arboricola pv. juglandis]|nr:hypothetical protein AKJ12_16900 [Xanthomonas arboricola pv. juglandis]KOB26999.1 hypothetical protein AE927_11790 [Xanthomonas arboricola]KOB50512.1 hypothetical protein AE932_06350 [Xanthomonas arboricola]
MRDIQPGQMGIDADEIPGAQLADDAAVDVLGGDIGDSPVDDRQAGQVVRGEGQNGSRICTLIAVIRYRSAERARAKICFGVARSPAAWVSRRVEGVRAGIGGLFRAVAL